MNRFILIVAALFCLVVAASANAQGLLPIGKDDHVLGVDKAPVTVIEYASLTCPHCARWEQEVFPKVKSDLIDTGKIRYAYRDFPLDGSALRASELAHCDESRFYVFLEFLFKSQSIWAIGGDPTEELGKIAKLGGLPTNKFQACMTDKALQTSIVASRQLGESAGVSATPTFFINGKKFAGEITFDDFSKAVAAASS